MFLHVVNSNLLFCDRVVVPCALAEITGNATDTSLMEISV